MYEKTVMVGLSGGLDSTVLTAWLLSKKYKVVGGFVNDGISVEKQLFSARRIAEFYEIPLYVFNAPSIGDWITNPDEYIPGYRGLVLLALLSMADRYKIEVVCLANAKNDSASDFIPDIQKLKHPVLDDHPEGIKKIEILYKNLYGRGAGLVLSFLDKNKNEIIKLGRELDVPFSLTCSCLQRTGQYFHCGVCSLCKFRKKAFKEAGISDPTKYNGGDNER